MQLTKAPKCAEAVHARAGNEELIKRVSDELLGSTNDCPLV